MSDTHFDTKPRMELSLPTQSSLADALKQGELARGVLDWLIISLCILGAYIAAKSQLDHEIDLSALPQKKVVKESPAQAVPNKSEVFVSLRNNEQEIWTDLKELIERKQPSKGHCQIHTSESKKKKVGSASGFKISGLKTSDFKQTHTEYELACWIEVNKKAPYPHKGTENLLDLNLLDKGASNDSPDLTDHKSAQAMQLKAHDTSLDQTTVQAEGWIQTPTGMLRFDAKEQRWR